MPRQLLLGQTLEFTGNPLVEGPDAARHRRHGAVLVDGGKIAAIADRDTLLARYPDVTITDLGQMLISPGFVDAHVHYPQTAMIASWGKRLIDWLNTYTFPEEAKFSSEPYAAEIAELYLDLILAHGTTTAASFCTIHPESLTAFFEAAAARDLRMVAGKTCMDRNAPDNLRDTAQSAYDDSKALIEAWHGRGRLTYAITPRFTPTSTLDQRAALGALWAEHPDCLMQTHLSEQKEEISWVRQLEPDAHDYLHTYERHGLVGPGSIMGHAIHLTEREIGRMAETGTGVAHCPTSNTFIGSGLCRVAALSERGIPVGLGTDTGGGSSFSMLRTMASAYEIAQMQGVALHPSALWWLATAGSAQVLRLDQKIGRLAVGQEADLIAIDLSSTPAIAQRAAQAETFWEQVFPTIMMGDDRAIAGVWIAGEAQHGKSYVNDP
ncbi:MAG: guanine deaminase [Pseudomonadota bacterium]